MSDEHFREVLYTVDERGRRRWVYSSIVKGEFFRYRQVVAYVLIAVYLLMPWITINGRQGVMLDFRNQRFVILGVEFWSTETFYLFLILGILAFALFFFTAVFGRLWCGWACPETVFLEFLFRPIERVIEGTPAQRKRLDESSWNFQKLWKKGLKHFLSALAAWVIASSTLAYVIGRGPLLEMMSDWPHNNAGPFLATLGLMALMAFQFGWFREQFCTVLCPYARFQSVLMDSSSLVVGYDVSRGEPRGKLSKQDRDGERKYGDCIDCGLCVRVCPTGIDIRNGLQLECVACTACIDACDSVMTKIDRPKGLIRYDTESTLLYGTSRGSLLRPRPVIYGFLLLGFFFSLVYLLSERPLTEVRVLRGALDAPYSVLADGRISNHLHVRIANKSRSEKKYTFRVLAPEVELITPLTPLPVPAETLLTTPLFANFPKEFLNEGKKSVRIILSDSYGNEFITKVTLVGGDD